MDSKEYLEWIKAQPNEGLSVVQKDEDHLILEDGVSGGEVNVYHLESDVIELQVTRKDDGTNVFFLHFELKDDDHARELYREMAETFQKQKNRKTLRILLSCTSGMTTSFFAEKLQEAADVLSLSYHVEATAYSSLYREALQYDVILLAPQIAYEYKKVKEIFPDKLVLKLPAQIFASYDTGASLKLIDEEMAKRKEGLREKITARVMRKIDLSLRIFVINLTHELDESRLIYRLYDAGEVSFEGEVIKRDANVHDIRDILDTRLEPYRKDHTIDAIALSLPGKITDRVGIRRVDYRRLEEQFREMYGLPAFICNNTKAVALGYYALQDKYDTVVYHSQPAGLLIGGQGLVVRGEPVLGAHAMGGELEPLFRMLYPDKNDMSGQSLEEIRESVVRYLVAASSLADPDVILIRSRYTPDTAVLRDEMKRYMEETNIPELVHVQDISEYAYLGTMIYGIYRFKAQISEGLEDTI